MDRNETRLHERPAGAGGEEQAAQPGASASAGGGTASGLSGQPQTTVAPASPARPQAQAVHARSLPVGEFHPPTHRRQRGLASRSWVPVALSFGTALLVAIALVIYFSQHQ